MSEKSLHVREGQVMVTCAEEVRSICVGGGHVRDCSDILAKACDDVMTATNPPPMRGLQVGL